MAQQLAPPCLPSHALLLLPSTHAPSPLPVPHPAQDLYERFMELANGQPVRREWVDVAMGRQLELPRAGKQGMSVGSSRTCSAAVRRI